MNQNQIDGTKLRAWLEHTLDFAKGEASNTNCALVEQRHYRGVVEQAKETIAELNSGRFAPDPQPGAGDLRDKFDWVDLRNWIRGRVASGDPEHWPPHALHWGIYLNDYQLDHIAAIAASCVIENMNAAAIASQPAPDQVARVWRANPNVDADLIARGYAAVVAIAGKSNTEQAQIITADMQRAYRMGIEDATTSGSDQVGDTARLRWTSELPTKPGVYFRKKPGEFADVIHVFIRRGDKLMFNLVPDLSPAKECEGYFRNYGYEFAGPIPEPEQSQ